MTKNSEKLQRILDYVTNPYTTNPYAEITVPGPKKEYKNFWCITCENYRTHAMITDELGTCVSCGAQNYAPTGDIL